VKHAPTRTCLGCRQRRPKRELVRLVRRPDGLVAVDAAGPGRGAYVCAEPACVERALKTGRLAHAFRAACRPGEGLEQKVLGARPSPAVVGRDIG
jgi:uncharacterized protein